jgi:transcriptional regulator with XRE-family HTH domain
MAMAGRTGVTWFSPSRLLAARRAAGLTQAQLARVLGYRHGQGPVGAWERGERRPDAPTLLRIAQALTVTVDDLLEPELEPTLELLRVRAGLTQAQLAARLGVSRSTWAVLEQGGRPLNADEIDEIADVLRCTSAQVRTAGNRAPSGDTHRTSP